MAFPTLFYMANPHIRDLEGLIIDERYKIGRCIGVGTMGAVYEAEHVLMKKRVALKMLHATHTQDPEVVQRFRREAQAAANIEHPNICSATDFGMYDSETYYLVMELLKGQSLAEAMAAGEMPAKRAIYITKQILSAVSEAHKIGVVHRDLKPENIILIEKKSDLDFVKITDFGIAQVRLFKDTKNITQVGTVYGSPLYLSPEQAQGEPVDFRADLYSIGIMLYEMLLGKVPFYAQSVPVVLGMHVTDRPRSFREIAPELRIPPELEAIVMRLLEKHPKDRYSSTMEVFDLLERFEEKHFATPSHPKKTASLSMPKRVSIYENVKIKLDALNRTQKILMVAAVLLILFSFMFILVFSFSDQTEVESSSEELVFVPQELNQNQDLRREFLASIEREDLEKLVESNPKKALEDLEVLVLTFPKSADLHFLRGKAYMALPSYAKAIEAYRDTILKDSTYASDSAILDDVFKVLESRKRSRAKYAETIILSSIKENATDRLAELAEHHRSSRVRKRALSLLKKLGQYDGLPEWNKLTISLRHAVSCEDNRKIIIKITELGNPKGLAALRRFASNPKNGCKGKDCYECARNDVRIGIEKLESK